MTRNGKIKKDKMINWKEVYESEYDGIKDESPVIRSYGLYGSDCFGFPWRRGVIRKHADGRYSADVGYGGPTTYITARYFVGQKK